MAKTNAAIVATLPPDVSRVQVIDEFGRTKYRKLSEVGDSDQILMDSSGNPITMGKGGPGRPKNPDMQPLNDQIKELMRAKEIHLRDDDLLDVVQKNPEASTVLDYVMVGLAEEASSLGFERGEAERKGMPTSQISIRRIGALKAVGDSWLKRKEQIAAGGVDLESTAFRKLFKFIMDTFRETLLEDAKVRDEMVETIFTSLSRRLDDDNWTREAIKKMTE